MAKVNSAYSIAAVPYYMEVAMATKVNIALVGAHGRGKTSVFNQFGEEHGYDEVIPINLSQMSPEDMIGLPITDKYKNETVTTYSCPDWLAKACDPEKKVILFFDEFTNGEDDTQASILKLIDERELLGRKLNDDTLIVMAFNPPEIAPNARDLSKATRDRICAIPIQDDDNSAYRKYYKDNDMELLANIVDEVPEIICDYTDEVTRCAYENAEFTYRSITHAYDICKYVTENKLPDFVKEAMCRGYGGRILGDTFVKYFDENYTSSAVNTTLANIAKNAKNGDDIIEGLRDNNISLEVDFANLEKIVKVIEKNATKKAFKDFMDKALTKEFSVAYFTD